MDRDTTLVGMLPAIRRLASRQTFYRERVGSECSDLAQESCLCFLEKWGTFDGIHANLFARWMVSHARRRLAKRHRTATEVLTDEPPARGDSRSDAERAEDAEERESLGRRLHAALDALPSRRREIVAQRYGLAGAPRTLRELAGGLGVTRQRVSQIEQAALAQLAHKIRTRENAHVGQPERVPTAGPARIAAPAAVAAHRIPTQYADPNVGAAPGRPAPDGAGEGGGHDREQRPRGALPRGDGANGDDEGDRPGDGGGVRCPRAGEAVGRREEGGGNTAGCRGGVNRLGRQAAS